MLPAREDAHGSVVVLDKAITCWYLDVKYRKGMRILEGLDMG